MIDEYALPITLRMSEQKNYCSEASAQMIFDYFDIPITQDQIHEDAWTIEEMMPLFSRLGLIVEDYNVHTPTFLYRIPTLILKVYSPVLIRYRYGGVNSGGHTVVCYGFINPEGNSGYVNGLKLLILDPDTGEEVWNVDEIDYNITNVYCFRKETKGDGAMMAAKRLVQKKRERGKRRRKKVVKKAKEIKKDFRMKMN